MEFFCKKFCVSRICLQLPAIGVNTNESVEDLTFRLDLFIIQAYNVRLYLEGLFQFLF